MFFTKIYYYGNSDISTKFEQLIRMLFVFINFKLTLFLISIEAVKKLRFVNFIKAFRVYNKKFVLWFTEIIFFNLENNLKFLKKSQSTSNFPPKNESSTKGEILEIFAQG